MLGEAGTYGPFEPPALNNLPLMEPGAGYLVRMRMEATLIYSP